MNRLRSFGLARAPLLLAALALAACNDGGGPVAPAPAPTGPVELARIRCTGHAGTPSLACAPETPGAGGAGALIVGGQGTYVQLTSSNVSYNAGTQIFAFDVTVANLLAQAMGTADGTTPAAEGVRVFFHSGPTAASGTASVANADGVGTFTSTGQPYFQYAGAALGADGILSPSETSSAKGWQLSVPPGTTFTFTLYVSADVPFPDGYVDVTPPADTVAEGGTLALSATVRTAVGNPVAGATVSWGTSDAAVATVDAAGVVTGVAQGTATITATAGARGGAASVVVCPDLSVGEVWVGDMPAASSFCLAGGGSGAEFTVVPVNLGDAGSLSLSFTGAGIVPVSGPPSPNRLPGVRGRALSVSGPRADLGFEARLRRTERRELGPKMHAARGPSRSLSPAGGPRRAITPGVPAVGALMSLNVETDDACSTFDTRTGRVMAVGTHVIVMADTLNPAGGLTAADYQAIADSFDAVVYPAVTGGFDDPATGDHEGVPADVDGNERVIAFYTRAVNELTPPGSGAYVGGFFFSRDLFDTGTCPTSNFGEMFYMLAADPAGAVNGNVRSASLIRQVTLGTLAHELQHMINASRRLYVNGAAGFEDVWLDEGLSHVAEELVFHAAAGTSPNTNLDAAAVGDGGVVEASFFKYAEANFGRLRAWLLAPQNSGLFQGDDDLATRGAAWAFLRYAADRRGGVQPATWSALMNSADAGLANVQGVLGTDPLPWIRDFTAAMYVDDAGLGTVASEYTHPSWNFRDLYAALDYAPGPACSCAYELAVRDPSSGVADAFTLTSGGAAAYLRLGVGSGAFAAVTLLSGGVAPPTTTRVAVIRRE